MTTALKKVKSTLISRAGSYLMPLLIQINNALFKSKKFTNPMNTIAEFRLSNGQKSHRYLNVIALDCHLELSF